MVEIKKTIDNESDIFDSIVCAEERFEDNGFSVGLSEGKERGSKTGFQKGLNLGKQIGEEIGFYQGFVLTWKKTLEVKQERNTRKMKALGSLLSMIESINISDPSVDDYMVKINQIRSKFKQVTSLLGVQVQYDDTGTGDPQPSYSF